MTDKIDYGPKNLLQHYLDDGSQWFFVDAYLALILLAGCAGTIVGVIVAEVLLEPQVERFCSDMADPHYQCVEKLISN